MVTKMQIAQALGVSHTCVSAVLNDRSNARISEHTRSRVLKQARLMGYESQQKVLHTLRKSTICYVLCDIPQPADASYLEILHALQVEAMKDKRQVSFMTLSSDPPAMAECLRAIDDHMPLGVVLDGRVPQAAVTAMAERKLTFVVSGATRYVHDSKVSGSVNAVGIDLSGGIDQLMRWFYEHGAHRVALSIGPPDLMIHTLVLEAYRHAAERTGPGYDPALVQIGEDCGGEEIVQRLGHLGVDYDGLLLCSIDRAIRVLSYSSLVPEQTTSPRLVGAFGSPELAGMLPDNVCVCGASLNQLGREIYAILTAEVKYAAVKKRVSIVPCFLRRACLPQDAAATSS